MYWVSLANHSVSNTKIKHLDVASLAITQTSNDGDIAGSGVGEEYESKGENYGNISGANILVHKQLG